MIEIFGPTYRYCGEILNSPEIIFVNDHHYDENAHCFHLKQLLENSACDPQQHLIVFDHISHQDQLSNYNHISLPVFLSASAVEFAQKKIKPNWENKTHAFNFMINKVRPHREFLLVLIKHFKLDNFTYSLCWKQANVNCETLIKNCSDPNYKEIIKNTAVDIPQKIYQFGQEILLDRGLKYGHVKNVENYTGLLQSTVFEPSCISLITEPSFYEKEIVKTEKTLMAMYGITLPIWVGGWQIPESLRKLGFDVFDDIIDHSYENLNDPWDRAFYAVGKNLDLLKDFDRVNKFISNNISRFQRNIELIEQNVFLQYITNQISLYDDKIKLALIKIVQNFNGHNIKHASLSNINLSSIQITQKLF